MGVMLLLVEDEPLIIDVVEDAFTEAGYQVITASDGGEALKELEADATRFRAIVTDVKLGSGPNGWAVAHRAREIVPTMAVVYMSGTAATSGRPKGFPAASWWPSRSRRSSSSPPSPC